MRLTSSTSSVPSIVPPQFDQYRSALMSLPGVQSSGWSKMNPDALSINVVNSELAYLVDSVLADTIDGMRIVITATGGMKELPADSWVRNPTNIARVMASLPGVVEFERVFGYTLFAENAERAAWLRKVVSPTINGTPVRVLLRADMP